MVLTLKRVMLIVFTLAIHVALRISRQDAKMTMTEELDVSTSTIEDLNKLINDIADKKRDFILDLDKSISEIFKKLIDIKDNDLFTFLRRAAFILIKIKKMGEFLRATEMTEISNKSDISSMIFELDEKKLLS